MKSQLSHVDSCSIPFATFGCHPHTGLAQCLLVKAPDTETRCDGEDIALHGLGTGGPETQISGTGWQVGYGCLWIDSGSLKMNVDTINLVSQQSIIK